MALRLALVDDHQMFRDALGAWLLAQPDVEIAFEASGGREACELSIERGPDVVLMDLGMPAMTGLDATAELLRRRATGRVLALSDRRDEELAARAFAAGARGCVCKEQPASVLLEAIRRVGRGEEYRPPWLSLFALDEIRASVGRLKPGATVTRGAGAVQPSRRQVPSGASVTALAVIEPEGDAARVLSPLTVREREVFAMLVGGEDNDSVAGRLGLSVKTVETHRARIMKKLEVHTLAQLVRFAARHHLL